MGWYISETVSSLISFATIYHFSWQIGDRSIDTATSERQQNKVCKEYETRQLNAVYGYSLTAAEKHLL
jgi:hypothetical protein